MSLAHELLKQAEHLAKREPTRPNQASLRRAVSTAYYALFHLLTAEAALLLAPQLSTERRATVHRWFDHNEMKKTCQRFRTSSFTKPSALAGLAVSDSLQTVASTFVNLQEARHRADYDIAASWTRRGVLQQVTSAKAAFSSWKEVKGTEEANVLLLSLLLWKHFEQDRS